MNQIRKTYTKEDLTIVWEPGKCIHSKKCWKSLGTVFKPTEKPWVDLEGADKDQIIAQVKECPSGALSYQLEGEEVTVADGGSTKINVMANGPLLLEGDIEISFPNDETVAKSGKLALCRCGFSGNKPYCDGSHSKHNFQG